MQPGAASGESAALGNEKPSGASTTHNVNFSINGVNTGGVQTASAADSNLLVSMLNQLQSAYRATGGA